MCCDVSLLQLWIPAAQTLAVIMPTATLTTLTITVNVDTGILEMDILVQVNVMILAELYM